MNRAFWNDFFWVLLAALATAAIIVGIFLGLMWLMRADLLPWIRPMVSAGITLALVVAWQIASEDQ